MTGHESTVRTRRGMLVTIGSAGVGGLAGCLGLGGGGDGEGDGDGDGDGGSGTGDGERRIGGPYRVAVPSDAETLVPFHITDDRSGAFLLLALDGAYAVTASPEDEVFPLWLDIRSDDNEVYVCELREGLRWSEPYGRMTADDWVYYLREVHQASDNWIGSVDHDAWQDKHVERTGTLEFQIELSAPDPTYPLRPDLWRTTILPQGLLEPYVEARDLEGLQRDDEVLELGYAGNLGPYTFERWDRDASFFVTRSEDYYLREHEDVPEAWRGSPYFESVEYRIIDEQSTRLNALSTGEVHATDVPEARVEEFQGREGTYVNLAPQPYIRVLVYNQRMNGWEPFRRREVRQAFSTAIDKVAILERIQRGLGEVTHTFQPTWSDYYVDREVHEFGEGDSHSYERARGLLAEALPSEYGYDGGDLLGPDGRQVVLDLVYPAGIDIYATTGEFIQGELAEIGVGLELNPVAGQTLLGRYVQNEWRGEEDPPWSAGPNNDGPRASSASAEPWDLMYGIGLNTYPRTPSSVSVFWHERAPSNFFGYVPERDLEPLWAEAASTADRDRQQELYGELFATLSEDQPVNFVNLSASTTGYRESVVGPTEAFGYGWNSTTWYFRT